MDGTSKRYSAAQALRTGGPAPVRAALEAARARTLLLMQLYADELAPGAFSVPYRSTLNPPLWEWGHIAWFQEWWIARNGERALGGACDPDQPRGASVLPGADDMYDSGRIAHERRWSLPLPGLPMTRDYLDVTLRQALAQLEAAPR